MNNPSQNNFKSALCAGCAFLFAAAASPAAVYSGILDLQIPATATGVYVDFETGDTPSPGTYTDPGGSPSYTIGYTEPTADWDVNLFFGGIGIAYSPTIQPFVDDTVDNRSQILQVVDGTVLSTEAAARTLGIGSEDFGGSGRSNGSAGESHFDAPSIAGSTYSAFTPGQQGSIAFVLNPGSGEQYGWMSVTLTDDGTPGTIHEWAFSDDASFQVGQIPEPGCLILLLVGGTTLLRRRRA